MEALRTVVPPSSIPGSASPLGEIELLGLAWAHDPDTTLRRVFDNSRTLGLGFRAYYAVDLTLVDLAELLPRLGAPCHTSGFRRVEGEAAWRSASAPCADAALPGVCDYWRESIHGLAGGLSSASCFTRLLSPAHDASSCGDLLHLDPESPLRFAPTRPEDAAQLDAITRLVTRVDAGAKLEFLGLSEGALHYRLQPSHGGCGLDTHAVLTRALSRRLPALRVCNASPRAVFTESP